MNMGLLALQPWVHMWSRDLIPQHVLQDAFQWRFEHRPPSQDAVALTYNHLNGHLARALGLAKGSPVYEGQARSWYFRISVFRLGC